MNKKRKTLVLSDLPMAAPSIGSRTLSPVELSLVIGGQRMEGGGGGGTSTMDDDVDGDGTCTLEDVD